ncbi:hypothetical protein YerA41_048 [Yersinia phage YerA41]|uniref:Uncharacterized protein n=1 Tax=Yersinia phage vB_Yru_GN1 TaxID=3074381 RepID=A0AA86J490_9CAUD|nr:hypothetical protein YerA41_048 [Yersinia phage YerA41]BES79863.1 hypothetical protein [Yersinia phage vB_Yru_GN1]
MLRIEDQSDKSIAISVVYPDHPMSYNGGVVIDQVMMKESDWNKRCDSQNVSNSVRSNRTMRVVTSKCDY